MLPQILAFTLDAGGPEGAHLDFGNWPFIVGSLPFVIVIVIIITLGWYFINKKRLEHQQILAAIEKGTSLSELRPIKQNGPNWIINLTAGIGFLFLGITLTTVILVVSKCHIERRSGMGLCIALVFLAIGIARLIRGILQRKEMKTPPLNLNQEK